MTIFLYQSVIPTAITPVDNATGGTADGSSTVTGSLIKTLSLTGSADGSSTVTGSLIKTITVSGLAFGEGAALGHTEAETGDGGETGVGISRVRARVRSRIRSRVATGSGGSVGSPSSTYPLFASTVMRIKADNPENVIDQVNAAFTTSDVILADNRINVSGFTYGAVSSGTGAVGTRVYFDSTGTLPAPLQAGSPYYLRVHASGGYEVYPETDATHWPNINNATSDETPLPIQNIAQQANKIIFSNQGSGVHRVYSNPLIKTLPDMAGSINNFNDSTTNLHSRWEQIDVNGSKALLSRVLGRDFTPASGKSTVDSYNRYGFKMERGGEANVTFQTRLHSKRSVMVTAVVKFDDILFFGSAKAPCRPADINTSTGVLTYFGSQSPGFATGFSAQVLPWQGAALPAELQAATDYWARVLTTSPTYTYALYPSASDANNDTNRIIPTTQGTVGFTVWMPALCGDSSQRQRDIAEVREQAGGGNTCAVILGVRSNNNTPLADINANGVNGEVGAIGRNLREYVPTGVDYARMRVKFPSGATRPVRTNSQNFADGTYYITRSPTSSVTTRFHDTLADAQASVGVATASATCIKFNSTGSGYMQVIGLDYPSIPIGAGVQVQTDVPATSLFNQPIGETGVLSILVDYNDPQATYYHFKVFWNGVKVADYENTSTKGLTNTATNSGDSGITLMNSPANHVPMQGLLYEWILDASIHEIEEDRIKEGHAWLMGEYSGAMGL